MADGIIILVVSVLLLLALRSSLKHFRGEKTCCGGSGRPASRHLDGPVIGSMRVRISGMHCENCARRIAGKISEIDGAVADVDWKSGIATVRYDRAIDEGFLREKIQILGYKVESVS